MATATKPLPHTSPDDEWVAEVEEAATLAAKNVRAERARRRAAGIIDANGKLLKPTPTRKDKDSGGWG